MLKIYAKYANQTIINDTKKIFYLIISSGGLIQKVKRPNAEHPTIIFLIKDYPTLQEILTAAQNSTKYGLQILKIKQVKR